MKKSELKKLIKECLVEESNVEPKLVDTIEGHYGEELKLYDIPIDDQNTEGFGVGDTIKYKSPTDVIYWGTIIGFPSINYGASTTAWIKIHKSSIGRVGTNTDIQLNHQNARVSHADLPENQSDVGYGNSGSRSSSSKSSRSKSAHQFADSIGGDSSNYKN
jgi:hypothetical protein